MESWKYGIWNIHAQPFTSLRIKKLRPSGGRIIEQLSAADRSIEYLCNLPLSWKSTMGKLTSGKPERTIACLSGNSLMPTVLH